MAVAMAVAVGVVLTSAGSRRDVDFFWHVLLGQSLLEGADGQGDWTSWAGDPSWRTAQPLAEVALYLADAHWGAVAPATVRALTAAAAMAGLFAVTAPWRTGGPVGSSRLSVLGTCRWLAFCAGAVVILGFSQERPAQIGLIAMPAVGAVVAWWLLPRHNLPRHNLLRHNPPQQTSPSQRVGLGLVLAALVLVWVGSHQSWLLAWLILVPAVTLSPRPLPAKAGGLIGLLAVMALASWWHGPPWRAVSTASAAADLVEWQPTDFTTLPAAPAVLMTLGFAALMAAARHSRVMAPSARTIVGVAIVLTILGVASASAWRHLPLSVLAAAALLVTAAQHLEIAAKGSHPPGPDGGRPSQPREQVTPPRFILFTSLALGAAVVAVHGWERLSPSPPTNADVIAVMAGEYACASAAPVTIATTYNDSGPALNGARRAGCPQARHARVVVDGRADRYGAGILRRWQAVIATEGHQWRADFLSAEADVALLPTSVPLVSVLQSDGWRPVQCRAGYVVLHQAP